MVMSVEATSEATEASAAPGPDPFVQMAFVDQALDDLESADLAQLDDEWVAHLVGAAGRLLARVNAFQVDVAGEAQRRGHGRSHGFFSARSYIEHHGRLSGPEARARLQQLRMFALLPEWAAAAHSGEVGVDQTRLMARVASNPRIHLALVANADELLCDAVTLPFGEFERLLRNFERLADPIGERRAAERHHEARHVNITQLADGSWRLSGRVGSLQGAEISNVFAHFVDAEFAADWAEIDALEQLPRTEPQRRADALAAALLAAAQAPGQGRGPLPTLSVLIDERTLSDAITGATPDPARYRDMVCRTADGQPLDVSEAASLACWAYVRRAVHTGKGVVTELGRRSRLFRGAAREAGLLLHDRCVWPGCDRPVRICQADHSIEWAHRGTTDPDNCEAMCGSHNRLKHRGAFTARRDESGNWSIRTADGTPIS